MLTTLVISFALQRDDRSMYDPGSCFSPAVVESYSSLSYVSQNDPWQRHSLQQVPRLYSIFFSICWWCVCKVIPDEE